jgi:uncharacterized damage-inducible protein DinB
MTAEQFEAFIKHAYWGLDMILDAAAELSEAEFRARPLTGVQSVQATLIHMLGFETFWGGILQGEQRADQPTAEEVRARDPDLAALRKTWAPVREEWLGFVATATPEQLNAQLEVKGPDKNEYQPRARLVLSQFVQHQGQHRSELAALVSQYGHSPGEFDWWDFEQIPRKGES